MTRMMRLVAGLFGFATLIAVQACAAPAEPGPEESKSALVDEALAMEGPQGGCSMKEIHYCQGLCADHKKVDSCYGNGVGWSTCNCNDGAGFWINSAAINGLAQ